MYSVCTNCDTFFCLKEMKTINYITITINFLHISLASLQYFLKNEWITWSRFRLFFIIFCTILQRQATGIARKHLKVAQVYLYSEGFLCRSVCFSQEDVTWCLSGSWDKRGVSCPKPQFTTHYPGMDNRGNTIGYYTAYNV